MTAFKDYFLQQLQQRTAMPFVEFMHYALYAPHVGYYSAGSPLGKTGDFMTAPELTPLFGHALAHQCASVMGEFKSPILFEFGAGSGKLCVDLLKKLQQLGKLPQAYGILDVSATLKAKQREYIQTHIPELFDRVYWCERWPEKSFEGIIIANEVLDAMPVHRFLQTEQGLLESYIAFKDNQFIEQFMPCDNTVLQQYVTSVLPTGLYPYLSEANLMLKDWMQQCARILEKGLMLIIDYGFPAHEYYHPDRNQGTLMCHTQHRTHPNVLLRPGQEDITAHVDFTQVAICADEAGFHVAGYTNQASFLLANHLLDDIQTDQDRQAIRQLTHPSEMGELFKVIGLTQNITTPLQGFQFFDKRASL
jgi:SAM-dependent MidA family methyltransferase